MSCEFPCLIITPIYSMFGSMIAESDLITTRCLRYRFAAAPNSVLLFSSFPFSHPPFYYECVTNELLRRDLENGYP